MKDNSQNKLNRGDYTHYDRVRIVKRWQTAIRIERLLSVLGLLAVMIGVFMQADAQNTTLGAVSAVLVAIALGYFAFRYWRGQTMMKGLQKRHPQLWECEGGCAECDCIRLIERECAKSSKRRIGCCAVLFLLMLCALWMLQTMYGYVANSRVESFNSNAKSVCSAIVTWQTDQAEIGMDAPLETGIYYISRDTDYKVNSMAHGIYRYFSDVPYWCAVVCDENGEILYTFYSNEEITEDELIPMEREQQLEIETNLFTRGEVVGWYAP